MVGDPPADTMYRSYIDQALGYFGRDHVGVPEGPVDDPAAWRSVKLDPTDWTVDLDDDQKAWFAMTGAAVAADDRPLAELDRGRIDRGPMATLVDRCRVDLDGDLVAALDEWSAIASNPAIHLDMELEPGDIQLCSNHTIAHILRSYIDDPAAPRHLLRLWLTL